MLRYGNVSARFGLVSTVASGVEKELLVDLRDGIAQATGGRAGRRDCGLVFFTRFQATTIPYLVASLGARQAAEQQTS